MNKAFINHWLSLLGIEVHGIGYMQMLKKQEFKTDAFDYQKNYFSKQMLQPIIFDVGANKGVTVKQYKEVFPKAYIHAFEPFPIHLDVLRRDFKDDKSVSIINKAIAEETKEINFYVNENSDTNSLLKPQTTGLSSDRQVKNKTILTVQTTTIDEYCRANAVEQIAILKMDIQGGELGALKGAAYMLTEKKIQLIYAELYFIQQYEKQPLFCDVLQYLCNYGYILQDIYNPIYGRGRIVWCDAIFIRKD